MSTIAQEYIREGLEQGLEKGLQRARETIAEVLAVRLGVPEETYRLQLDEINDPTVLRRPRPCAVSTSDTSAAV